MKQLLTLLLLLFGTHAFAQEASQLKVSIQTMPDQSIQFSAHGPMQRMYTLYLDMPFLTNCLDAPRETQRFIIKREGSFLTLRPSNSELPIGYRYSYTYYEGVVDATPNNKIIYRIPLSTKRKSTVNTLYNLRKPDTNQSKDIGFSFSAEAGDTVYAARSGRVVLAGVDYHVIKQSDAYGINLGKIQVEHSDGTIAQYGTVDQRHIFVEEGDMVYPDTPLALVGTRDGETASIDLSLYIIYTIKDEKGVKTSTWQPFDARFATDKGETQLTNNMVYLPVVTPELLTQEMPKKMAHKYKK